MFEYITAFLFNGISGYLHCLFICMKDSDVLDDDGFPVQELYVHYLPAIYPGSSLTVNENAKRMMEQNHALWVGVYEKFYGEKLPDFLQ